MGAAVGQLCSVDAAVPLYHISRDEPLPTHSAKTSFELPDVEQLTGRGSGWHSQRVQWQSMVVVPSRWTNTNVLITNENTLAPLKPHLLIQQVYT